MTFLKDLEDNIADELKNHQIMITDYKGKRWEVYTCNNPDCDWTSKGYDNFSEVTEGWTHHIADSIIKLLARVEK